jgi:nucleotide-binding universal stress UspA family protein
MTERVESVEWSWSNSPVVLPVAYQPREWNAVYIAFYIAEYSGSRVLVTHVMEGQEDHIFRENMMKEIESLSRELSVKYDLVEVEPASKPPSVEDVAMAIVSTAESKGAQAIVMSAHREPLFRELFGRVSDHVARHSKKKVILVETPQEGITVPKRPKRILIPVLKEQHPDPYIIAAALTSSASVPDVEITAAKIIELPPTTPLDAVETARSLRLEERDFSYFTSLAIKTLGRLFTPKILPVREAGRDLAEYVRERGVDIIVMYSSRSTGFYSFLTKQEYEIVSKSPCVVLVTLSSNGGS